MTTNNAKNSKFEAAFAKAQASLSKDYVNQFKKPEYAGDSKKEKVKDSLRKGNATIVSKNTGNKHTKPLNEKLLNPDVDVSEIVIKTVPKEIATQVQQARTKANKTQDELAKMVEVKLSAVKDLEAGEGAYDAQLVVKIEKALKVTFDRSWKKK